MMVINKTKYPVVKNRDQEMISKGIIAFQMVEILSSFYGQDIDAILDTKIMEDGSQIIIDGDGYFKAGMMI